MHAKGEKGPQPHKMNFLDEGGVTSLGGRTIWGRGKEWKGISARMGVELS
jgi:hypothetical protein